MTNNRPPSIIPTSVRRSATRPVTREMPSSEITTYYCPACESVIPASCVTHTQIVPRISISSAVRTTCVSCPHCNKRHKADYRLDFGRWTQLSDVVEVTEPVTDPELLEALAVASGEADEPARDLYPV